MDRMPVLLRLCHPQALPRSFLCRTRACPTALRSTLCQQMIGRIASHAMLGLRAPAQRQRAARLPTITYGMARFSRVPVNKTLTLRARCLPPDSAGRQALWRVVTTPTGWRQGCPSLPGNRPPAGASPPGFSPAMTTGGGASPGMSGSAPAQPAAAPARWRGSAARSGLETLTERQSLAVTISSGGPCDRGNPCPRLAGAARRTPRVAWTTRSGQPTNQWLRKG